MRTIRATDPSHASTTPPDRRPEPSRFPLFVAALCGFVARTNPRQGYFNSEAAAERFETVINSCVEGPSTGPAAAGNNARVRRRGQTTTMLVKTTPLLSPSRSSFRSGRHSNWRGERGREKQKETRGKVSRRGARATLRSSSASFRSSRYILRYASARVRPSVIAEQSPQRDDRRFSRCFCGNTEAGLIFRHGFFAVELQFFFFFFLFEAKRHEHGNDFIAGMR